MTKEIIAVLDCDEIAFQIAAACEKRYIKATNLINNQSSSFKHRTELKKFLHGLEVPDDFYKVEDVQEPDELASALHTVKVKLKNIKEACKADKVELYLSGKDNFRSFLPLPTEYKSKRKDTIKPILLPDIREYLVQKQGAIIVDGEEVDDMMCHRMWDGVKNNQKIIGVTTDKDAVSNAGWLYNPDKMKEPEFNNGLGKLWLESKINGKGKEEFKVRGVGRKFLYLQVAIGDSTDDYNPSEICGIEYGEKSAYKLLEPLKSDKECWQALNDLYKSWYPEPFTYKDWRGVEWGADHLSILQMYLDCARMRRWVGDHVLIKDIFSKLEINI